MIQELLLSAQWVVIKLIPLHTRSMRKLFSIVVVLTVKTFEQHNNLQGLYVSDDYSENTSECHFKHRKIRPNLVYYDETNSHPLDADVFFANVLTSTQPMELDGEEVIF